MINTLESSGACANHSLPSHPMASRGHQASLTTVDDTYTLCSLPSLFLSFCANGSCFIEMTSKSPPFTPKRAVSSSFHAASSRGESNHLLRYPLELPTLPLPRLTGPPLWDESDELSSLGIAEEPYFDPILTLFTCPITPAATADSATSEVSTASHADQEMTIDGSRAEYWQEMRGANTSTGVSGSRTIFPSISRKVTVVNRSWIGAHIEYENGRVEEPLFMRDGSVSAATERPLAGASTGLERVGVKKRKMQWIWTTTKRTARSPSSRYEPPRL